MKEEYKLDESIFYKVQPKQIKWSPLSSITVSNFKAISSLTLPLGRVNILVGPNGSGKSSVLQAIHWAARAASYIPQKNQSEVISFDRFDYLPSSDPLLIPYKRELSSDKSSTPVMVRFQHVENEVGQAPCAEVKIWAARNKGGVSAKIEGGAAVSPFKQRENFITAYIPGLAGLSEKETILAKPLLRRQAASGDAGGVLRNVLLNIFSLQPDEADNIIANRRKIKLNELISRIHPGFSVFVDFDDREDVHIKSVFRDKSLPNLERPLESAATGVLQVIQIFAYIIFFKPKILLIDEPDAHLHPDKQERLIEALEDVAEEFDTQIIISTHSPHVVHAASSNSKLFWLKNGEIVDAEDSKIRKLLGWGGLDKKLIFFVEDEDDLPIRALLKQWPHINRQVMISSCFGLDNLPKSSFFKGVKCNNILNIKFALHRDRDFMTDLEIEKWSESYKREDVEVWCTSGSDVESYFCDPRYIASLYRVDIGTAKNIVDESIASIPEETAKGKFKEKRKLINQRLYVDTGGSPNIDHIWQQGGGKSISTILGKTLHKAIKNGLKNRGLDDKKFGRFETSAGFEMATDLKELLQAAIEESA